MSRFVTRRRGFGHLTVALVAVFSFIAVSVFARAVYRYFAGERASYASTEWTYVLFLHVVFVAAAIILVLSSSAITRGSRYN